MNNPGFSSRNQFQNQQQNQYGYTPQYDTTTQYPLGPDGYSSVQGQVGDEYYDNLEIP